jgi:hypothetical protein
MAKHNCPAPNCTADVPHNQLACRGHWYSIPKEIRDRVWSAYRANDTKTHAQAVRDAVSFLNARDARP